MNEFPRLLGMPEEIPVAKNYVNLVALTYAILLSSVPDPMALYARAAQALIMADSAYGYVVRNLHVSLEDEECVEDYLAKVLADYDIALAGLPNYSGYIGQLIKGVIDYVSDVRALLYAVLDDDRPAENPEKQD